MHIAVTELLSLVTGSLVIGLFIGAYAVYCVALRHLSKDK